MGWLLAPLYDRMVAPAEEACFGGWRSELLGGLDGKVIEIGAGTGVNIEHYPASVESVTFVEPDPGMRRRLEAKLAAARSANGFAPGDAEVVAESADRLPFADHSFDAAVSTLVLCTVPDPSAALKEVRRVLRPGGRLVFLEHVAALDRPDRLKWQRRIDPLWHRVMGGCHLTRDTARTIESAGFTVDSLTAESARKASPVVRPTIRGLATSPV